MQRPGRNGSGAPGGPQGFVRVPGVGGGGQPMQQQAARVVQVGAVGAAPVVVPPVTLTVARTRRLLLTKALIRHLNLQHGQRVDLVPRPRGQPWELDTSSRTGSAVRLRDDGKGWLTMLHHIGSEHFYLREGASAPVRSFTLGAEDPARPGLYYLLPA